MRRAPGFWRADGVVPRLFSPLGALYGAAAQMRLWKDAPRAALPTIVVGGLTAGGDGKTPLAIALAKMLAAPGERPAVLTRGYRARRAGPFVVDPGDDADVAGDEAPLLARHALTIVGADRARSAELARELGASLLLLDDGFHSRRLSADLSLLAIDAEYGAGNGRCIPAGPLRAPLAAQLDAADALVVIGQGTAGEALAARCAKPVFRARIVPDRQVATQLAGARVVAFAGIGRPEKFFRTLCEAGAEIVATRAFPDHHRFTEKDVAELAALAHGLGARLATTEKDALRLRASALPFDVLPISLDLAEPMAVAAALERARLSRAS